VHNGRRASLPSTALVLDITVACDVYAGTSPFLTFTDHPVTRHYLSLISVFPL